jgi:hypothetical protein
MGLSWQQGPLASAAIGPFPTPDPLPERLLYAKPLRRRRRVRFGGAWIADSYHRIDIRQASRSLDEATPAGQPRAPGAKEHAWPR